jgi:predicted DNA-binding transcriptional regulator AlpA
MNRGAEAEVESLLTESQAAQLVGLSARTLERFRIQGAGPKFLKLGRRVFYAQTDLLTWLDSRRYTRTSDVRHPPRS